MVMRAYTPTSTEADKGHFDLVVKVYWANEHPDFPEVRLIYAPARLPSASFDVAGLIAPQPPAHAGQLPRAVWTWLSTSTRPASPPTSLRCAASPVCRQCLAVWYMNAARGIAAACS